MEYSTTCCISICDVYGESNPKIPEGYKKIDFRPYKAGDVVLLTWSKCAVEVAEGDPSDSSYGRPYIILEKLLPKPEVIENKYYRYTPEPKIVTVWDVYHSYAVGIPQKYKYVDFRPPTSGEYYIAVDFTVEKAGVGSHGKESPRIILEKV